MSGPPPVDEIQARAFLETHLGRPAEGVELVGEGAWSRCFGFRDRGRERVIRLGRFVEDFEKDRRARAFDAPGLPVPEVVAIGPAFGAWFAISARVRGEPLELRGEAGWRAVLPALFDALDALRAADLSGTAGFGHWDASADAPHRSWREFLLAVDRDAPDGRTHGWRRRLADAPGGDAIFRAGYERLAGLAAVADAVPGVRHLVHADLINRNVLVEGDRITGVFDWGCSCYGDFLYDVAWLAFWAPWYPALAGLGWVACVLEHYGAIGLDVPDFEPRLRACMIHIGLDHLAYNAWAGREDDLAWVTKRMLPLLDGEVGSEVGSG